MQTQIKYIHHANDTIEIINFSGVHSRDSIKKELGNYADKYFGNSPYYFATKDRKKIMIYDYIHDEIELFSGCFFSANGFKDIIDIMNFSSRKFKELKRFYTHERVIKIGI